MHHIESGFEKLRRIFKGFNGTVEMLEIWLDKFSRVSEEKFNNAVEKIIDGNDKLPYNVINEMWKHIKAQSESGATGIDYSEYQKILLSNYNNGIKKEEWTMSNGREAYRWVRNPLGSRIRIETVEGQDIPIYAR